MTAETTAAIPTDTETEGRTEGITTTTIKANSGANKTAATNKIASAADTADTTKCLIVYQATRNETARNKT